MASALETISSSSAVVTVDLDGGSIMHFGATAAARDNVLASFEPDVPAHPDTGALHPTHVSWLTRYRGGWQLLTPSGGAPSVVGGVHHPFHGEVSVIPWTLESHTPSALTMRTIARDSFGVTRTLALEGSRLRVTTTVENGSSRVVPAMFVEHIALALGEDARVIAPEGSEWESGTDQGTIMTWPSGLDTPIPAGRSRVISLVGGNDGWVELRRPSGAVRVEWEPRELPYLWYWQERLTDGFPFYGSADVVGLEPSSVRFGDGLDSVIDRGEAWMLEPGASRTATVEVMLL